VSGRHKETLAMMRAAAKVRDGRWVNGAPSHVFAEFAKQLNEDGWELVPTEQGGSEKQHVEQQDRAIERIRKVARDHGYAVAIHGSRKRDLDLIAVPWTDEASTAEELLNALNERENCSYGPPNERPHGRVGHVLHGFAGCKYVDLSITPRKTFGSVQEIEREFFPKAYAEKHAERLPARVALSDPTKPPPLKATLTQQQSPEPHLPVEDRERLFRLADIIGGVHKPDADPELHEDDARFLRNLASAPSGGEQRRVEEELARLRERREKCGRVAEDERNRSEVRCSERGAELAYEYAIEGLEAALSDQRTGGSQ
jgi:hypothetical protein